MINYSPVYENVSGEEVVTDTPARAFLYDITGRCVKDMGILEPGKHDLSGLNLEKGVYILMVGNRSYKIVK